MKITLIDYTKDALDKIVFARRTRLKMTADSWGDVQSMPVEEKMKELEHAMHTIQSGFEFIDYIFLIEGVTRAFCLEKGTTVIVRKLKHIGNTDKLVECKGSKKIEDIVIGDEVYSYNTLNGKKEWDKVIFTSCHMTDDWFNIEFNNGNGLSMTGEHPVYVVGRLRDAPFKPQWVPARDLRIGDEAIQANYLGIHSRTSLRGKTLEQSFGSSTSSKIKQAIRKSNSKSFKERFGNKALAEIEKRVKHLRGKTYEDIHGLVRALELKELRKVQAKHKSNLPEISYLKTLWKEERKKMMLVAKKAGIASNSQYFGKRSKAEDKLESILDEICPGEFKYNGTGDLGAIGYRLPDFVNVNGKKKVIELFGCYWHSCPICGFDKIKKKNDKRIHQDYAKLGYDCLVIWEHELKDKSLLTDKIKTFLHNPDVAIVRIAHIEKSNIWRNSYNIETKKNHNFFAYGILTHNTHQLVRHRVGVSFAQQAQRVVDASGFEYLATGDCKGNVRYQGIMEDINCAYEDLIRQGVHPQDARGILPTNVLTNILMKINLRALADMMSVRLCKKSQGEFQRVAKEMKRLVETVHPIFSPMLMPFCVKWQRCFFPDFKDCPVQPVVPISSEVLPEIIKRTWEASEYEAQSKEIK